MPTFEPVAWLFIFWLAAIGGAVGSFLNVVVYRLPIGLSLVHPPSHCPKCGKPIAWYDNVPVLGWLMLRGRCRQCHNPISARYPIIEAIAAAMFGAVAIAEMRYMCDCGAFGLYPYHMLLLCTLLSAALIEYDNNHVPGRLFLPVFVVGMAAPFCFSTSQLVPKLVALPDWLQVAGVVGIVILLGIAGWELHARKSIGLFFSVVCVGLYLGNSGAGVVAASVVLFDLLLKLLGRVWPRLHIPTTMLLCGFAFAWMLVWPRLTY